MYVLYCTSTVCNFLDSTPTPSLLVPDAGTTDDLIKHEARLAAIHDFFFNNQHRENPHISYT